MTNSDKQTPKSGADETEAGSPLGTAEDAEIVGNDGRSERTRTDEPDDAARSETDGSEPAPVESEPEAERAETAPEAEPSEATARAPASEPVEPAPETGSRSGAGEPAPETEPPVPPIPPAPALVAPRIARGPGFLTLLLGGLLAGAIGYGLAYYTEFRPFAGPPAADPSEAIAELQATATDQADRLSVLETQGGDLGTRVSDLSDRIAALDQRVADAEPGAEGVPPAVLDDLRATAMSEVEALGARLGEMEGRLDELAGQLAGLSDRLESGAGGSAADGEALNAYQRQLEALQQELDAQRSAMAEAQERAEALGEAAQAQQRAVLAEAALARVRAAVQGGGSFSGALSDLASVADVEVPEALTSVAGSGVKTLPQLQDSFDPAARDALEAAIEAEAGQGTTMERLGNFLRSQTGARSLTEREGDDPDAILSRARARLSEGDVAAALDELSALGEAGQAAMAGWIADARARVDALAAVDSVSAAVGGAE